MSITRYTSSTAGGTVENNSTMATASFQKSAGPLATGDVVILGVARYSGVADLPISGDCTKSAGDATVGTIVLDKVADNNFTGTEHIYACIWRIPITGNGSLTLQVVGGTGNYWVYGIIIYTASGGTLQLEDSQLGPRRR